MTASPDKSVNVAGDNSAKVASDNSAGVALAASASRDYRIPALFVVDGALTLLADERPHPIPGEGWLGNGGAMADDLPNPNRIVYAIYRDGAWSEPRPLGGDPEVRSDACVGVDGDGITLAYGSSTEVGYFGSRFSGPRIHPYIAYGRDLETLEHRSVDCLYEEFKCDGMFATSGSTVVFDGVALLPYVVKSKRGAEIRVIHAWAGEIIAVSEPIRIENPGEDSALSTSDNSAKVASANSAQVQLDETTLAVANGKVYANFRLQGRGGRWVSESDDGLHWATPHPLDLPDPGCNAKLLALDGELLLIHPHTRGLRPAEPEAASVGLDDSAAAEASEGNAEGSSPSSASFDQTVTGGSALLENQPVTNSPLLGAREGGAIVDYEENVRYRFSDGEFGYSDAAVLDDAVAANLGFGEPMIAVAYERAHGINVEFLPLSALR